MMISRNDTNMQTTNEISDVIDNKINQDKLDPNDFLAKLESENTKTDKRQNEIDKDIIEINRLMNLLKTYKDGTLPPDVYQAELEKLPPDRRRFILDFQKQKIKEYDESFDLENVIEQNSELKNFHERIKQTTESVIDIQNQLVDLETYAILLLNEARARGAVLIYDESGNPVDYEKDGEGNPILINTTGDTGTIEPDSIKLINNQTTNNDIKLQVANLWINASEQFPEALFAPHLTQQEFDVFYPTEELKQSLENRKNQMRDNIVSELRSLLPSNIFINQTNISPILKEALYDNFDKDFANSVIKQLKAK